MRKKKKKNEEGEEENQENNYEEPKFFLTNFARVKEALHNAAISVDTRPQNRKVIYEIRNMFEVKEKELSHFQSLLFGKNEEEEEEEEEEKPKKHKSKKEEPVQNGKK